MKKHLIAAAVAAAVAAPAFAQNVSIYGILGTGYDNLETKLTAGATSYTRKQSSFGSQNMQSGNRLGFRGTEDLGGGLKAGFVFEMHADLIKGTAGRENAGSGVNQDQIRQGFVSLSGGFGEVRFGRGNSLSKDVYDTYHTHFGGNFNPGNQTAALSNILTWGIGVTGTSTAQLDDLGSYGNVRHNNMVSYISPSISGLTIRAQYAQDKTEGPNASVATATEATTYPVANSKTTVANIGANYNAGPISIGFAHDTTKVRTNDVKTTLNIIGGSYDLGVAKPFLAYTAGELKSTPFGVNKLELKDVSIGVSIPLGATTINFSYSDGEIEYGTVKVDTKGYQLGANYALSKRTFLLARYGDSEAKYTDVKGSIDGFALGIQHSF